MYDSELNKLLSDLRRLDKTSDFAKTNSVNNSNLDFLLDIENKKLNSMDKDLTLSEYLNKYNKVEEIIETESQSKRNNSGYEELLKELEGNSDKYIEKKIDEDFEYREVKTLFSKKQNGSEDIKTKDIFTNKSKERCNNVTVRIKNYANTKSQLTTENKMSPLDLEQFTT